MTPETLIDIITNITGLGILVLVLVGLYLLAQKAITMLDRRLETIEQALREMIEHWAKDSAPR
jgi:hypothetical protein